MYLDSFFKNINNEKDKQLIIKQVHFFTKYTVESHHFEEYVRYITFKNKEYKVNATKIKFVFNK